MTGSHTPAPPAPSQRGATFTLPLLIAVVVVASMTTLGAVLIWQGWQAARSALLLSARDSTLAMGRLVDEKIQRLLAPASITLRHLARDPLVEASSLGARLDRLPLLTEVLKSIPFASAIYVGYANGDFILVRPLRAPGTQGPSAAPGLSDVPADAVYLVQSVVRDTQGTPRGQWQFYDESLRLIGVRTMPDYTFDPRTRPWYADVQATPGEHLTVPYVFFTTQRIGVTMSAPSWNHEAVVGLDVDLSDLGEQLKSLRLTPHSELAIAGNDGSVYAYTDLSRNYRRVGDEVHLAKLSELGVPALSALAASGEAAGEAGRLSVDGETWFGVTMPLSAFQGRQLHLLMATPDDDLLASIRAGIVRQAAWTLGFAGVLLLGGWLVGHRLGRDLGRLTLQAQRLTRFDFRKPAIGRSLISEIRELEDLLGEVCVTIENFLTTSDTIGNEPRLDAMLDKVLEQMVAATGCSRGAVYLLDAKGQRLTLAATAGGRAAPPAPGEPLSVAPGTALATADAHALPSVLPPEAIAPGHPAVSDPPPGTGRFALALTGRAREPLGLLLLEHPDDATHGGTEFRAFAERLSGALSSSIETRNLIQNQKDLLDSLVHLLADAIDSKSPYTGGHCRRVPELATMIVDRMVQEQDGPFSAFRLSPEQRYEFHLGAWLHDCGKVTSPEHVIDKATKLETIHNRIHEVRTRFEVLWRDEEIAHLQRLSAGADAAASEADMRAAQDRLREDFAFVAACNIGSEFMTDEAIARLYAISARTWLRHFDDRLGLSSEEERRLGGLPAPPLPAPEPVLADRPEHAVPWLGRRPPVERGDPANVYGFDMALPEHAENRGELYNLSISRGTLTAEERFKINEHVVQTYIMLKSLPWPAHLRRVPDIAATHHERMDGTGYPRRLPAGGLPVEERVVALADVFEALTAADRPYKSAKTLSQALRIMAFMCKEGHLDPDVFRYFIESGLWETYAERFLRPDQRDGVNLAALLSILPQQQPPATGLARSA